MKKKYIVPKAEVEIVIMPQLLVGSGIIESGGDEGGGHHGITGDDMDISFEEESVF